MAAATDSQGRVWAAWQGWRDATPVRGKQSHYYVRGEQEDGEIVWVSPMWITYTGQ